MNIIRVRNIGDLKEYVYLHWKKPGFCMPSQSDIYFENKDIFISTGCATFVLNIDNGREIAETFFGNNVNVTESSFLKDFFIYVPLCENYGFNDVEYYVNWLVSVIAPLVVTECFDNILPYMVDLEDVIVLPRKKERLKLVTKETILRENTRKIMKTNAYFANNNN